MEELANAVLSAVGAEVRVRPDDVALVSGGDAPYGELTGASAAAITAAARSGGLIVDPVYSGRALAALPEVLTGTSGVGPVVFLHKGGQPALFADDHAREIVRRAGGGPTI